jgi:hypothetical protein
MRVKHGVTIEISGMSDLPDLQRANAKRGELAAAVVGDNGIDEDLRPQIRSVCEAHERERQPRSPCDAVDIVVLQIGEPGE